MRPSTRTALAALVSVALTGGLLTLTASSAAAADGTAVAKADFNGDGKGDVAANAATAYVSGHAEAGQIAVLYGASGGVTATNRTLISQNTAGVPGAAEPGDEFGAQLAYGDFNGDGYDDLAASAPGEDVGDTADAGSVTLLWGSPSGLTGTGSVTVANPADGVKWGSALVAGDFDGDRRDDLVVSDRDRTVQFLKGGFSASGVPAAHHPLRVPADYYPWTLTAGDVNGDGSTDLVSSGTYLSKQEDGNDNLLFLGGPDGPGSPQAKELRSGWVTAVGDIDRDGYGDIVSNTGSTEDLDGNPVPYTHVGGQIWITYGSADGNGRLQAINQDTAGVPGAAEESDGFGLALDLGDVDKDGYLDLAVGVPQEDVDGVEYAGSVVVLRGTANGLTGTGAQVFHQNTAGVPGENEHWDRFGIEVKLDDVTGDGRADLLAGTFENDNGGIVQLVSDGTKITATGSRSLSPTALGVSTSGAPRLGHTFAD
ncbi:FG-GAP-like repeat-containing protein [Streptomyces sp. UH6]|uniref:FG-GAP-like repeat-containing protein n=1 Tax=Streptomyces sp. UH6 TaxID=2748379 RepID=UPI0015D4F104|nr:FG-GAP-like repeat-containing protein [Streptomyces sp. UH6]NYV78553.1 FG-GAP repeat protein [Streptomyces sp. UH6]